MRIPLFLLMVSVSAAECNRAPAEDFRPVSAAVSSASVAPAAPMPSQAPVAMATSAPSSGSSADRCVKWTPSAPPPAVAPGPAPGCPADPEARVGAAPTLPLTFPENSEVSVDAEFVRSEHDTTRGLMYRTSMPEDHGMLFDLRAREDHRFWMHNTCIPLDMLFIDEDGLIVGIVENAPTLNDDSQSVGCPSRWVLEVNAGWSRRHRVKAGGHMTLPKT